MYEQTGTGKHDSKQIFCEGNIVRIASENHGKWENIEQIECIFAFFLLLLPSICVRCADARKLKLWKNTTGPTEERHNLEETARRQSILAPLRVTHALSEQRPVAPWAMFALYRYLNQPTEAWLYLRFSGQTQIVTHTYTHNSRQIENKRRRAQDPRPNTPETYRGSWQNPIGPA